MIELPLSQGYVAMIDDEDEALARFKWTAKIGRTTVYAVRAGLTANGKRPQIWLHRAVLGVTGDVDVDHRDGNGLDCRRHNLRVATTVQNQRNMRRPAHNTSGFKGVSWSRAEGRWRARLMLNGKDQRLGNFKTREDAARAYDAAALEVFGEFARLNYPPPSAPEPSDPGLMKTESEPSAPRPEGP